PHFLRWSPMFHWTDPKIRVHAFYCVLALTLCSLLRRELHLAGIDLSIPTLLETLSDIHEVALVYTGRGRRKNPLVLSERSPLQQEICKVLRLDQLAPTT
ncbi:MAG: hypothetical protein M1602_06605, partial [Firmicutes bacterium]|nr:hypothetical protein [Bacillota bacterium]